MCLVERKRRELDPQVPVENSDIFLFWSWLETTKNRSSSLPLHYWFPGTGASSFHLAKISSSTIEMQMVFADWMYSFRTSHAICGFSLLLLFLALSLAGQYEANPAPWLATREDEIELPCLLGIARYPRAIIQSKFTVNPYNKPFIGQVCSVKMALFINTQKKILFVNIPPSWPNKFGQ